MLTLHARNRNQERFQPMGSDLKRRLRAFFRRNKTPPRRRRAVLESLESRRPLAADFDVWIESVDVPAELWAGENVDIRWQVRSQSEGSVPQVSNSVFLSSDEVLSSDDVIVSYNE